MKFLKFRSASSYAGHHEQPPPFPAAIYNIENPGFASAWICLTSLYRTRLHLDADNPRPTRPLSPPARRTTTGYRQRTFYNLTTRHRPTAHRDERTGAPASQRIASQLRHDWKRRHPSSRTTGRTWHSTEQDLRDGKERRVPTTTTRTCKFTFRARCSNPDASVSAGGAWRQAAGPHCPFGLLGARTLVENLVFLTTPPPPHAKIIESDRAAMVGVAQHFFLQSCCRPSDLIPKRAFSLTWPPTLRIRRWFGTIVLYGIDNGSAPAGSKPVQGRARP